MKALGLVGFLAGCALAPPPPPPAPAVPPVAVTAVPRWEYFCANLEYWQPDAASTKLLDVAGQHGWELVAVIDHHDRFRYCFKRPRP